MSPFNRCLASFSPLLFALGCAAPEEPKTEASDASSPAPESASAPETAPAPEAAPTATAGGDITVSGTLAYTELPRTKSVEAYMGREFTLTDAEGAAHNLKASEAVSHDSLVALDGKEITVTCTPYPAEAPDAMESAPTDMDGNPLERPAGCRVVSIDAGAE